MRIGAVALNHIDVWGWRGMAFAKRKLPIVVGVEAAGTVAALGEGVEDARRRATVVALFGAETCGVCPQCRAGRDNLCENVHGIRGFHIDGLARELDQPARPPRHSGAARRRRRRRGLAPVTYGTPEHMLFDNAKLTAGQTILVQAGGSGIGTAAIQLAKAAGATVITTVGSEEKIAKAKALGADHVINYREERFEGVVRKLTQKRGVDVVFEHVGVDTFPGSMFSLKRGGTLVICGSTTGISRRDQPLPALPAAVAADRQLRLLDQEPPRLARQDGGGRRPAGHRCDDFAGGDRRGAGAARIAQRLRQDHRDAVSEEALREGSRTQRRKARRAAAAAARKEARLASRAERREARWAAKQLRASRRIQNWPVVQRGVAGLMRVFFATSRLFGRRAASRFAGDFMREVGPFLHEHRIGLTNLEASFPEMNPVERAQILSGVWDSLARATVEYAFLPTSSPPSIPSARPAG